MGSNIQNIFLYQLIHGKLELLKRLKDTSTLDINITTVIRGAAIVTYNQTMTDVYTGLSFNEEFLMNLRIPTLLCLNNKLELVQYQLIEFNPVKFKALTSERNKYEPLLMESKPITPPLSSNV